MISFGYRDKDTSVHRLNPFGKLAWVGSIFILALLFNSPLYVFLLFLSTLPLIITARVWREWASFMKFTLYLCLLVIVINALVSYHGSHIIWQAPFRIPVMGVPQLTLEAVLCGIGNSLKLLAIISAFTILIFTIHPDDLMLVLTKLRLPYKSVLVTSLSTRFVPTLIGDAERISEVQRLRGLELDRGKLSQRIKGHMAIIIPLLSNSLDRTVQVAEAMESRAFGVGGKRTYFKEIKMSPVDGLTLVFGVLPGMWGIFMHYQGLGVYQYYPTVEGISLSGAECGLLLSLLILLTTMVFLAFLKGRVELD